MRWLCQCKCWPEHSVAQYFLPFQGLMRAKRRADNWPAEHPGGSVQTLRMSIVHIAMPTSTACHWWQYRFKLQYTRYNGKHFWFAVSIGSSGRLAMRAGTNGLIKVKVIPAWHIGQLVSGTGVKRLCEWDLHAKAVASTTNWIYISRSSGVSERKEIIELAHPKGNVLGTFSPLSNLLVPAEVPNHVFPCVSRPSNSQS